MRSNITSENINSQTKSGWTVLHYAVILNNLEAAEALFYEILPQNEDSLVGYTQGDQEELIHRKSVPQVNFVDDNGLTAVHVAVINNNIEILSLLLRNKAKVKVLDDFDRTPLHYSKSERATKLLLTQSSRNKCFETNRNAEEGNGYNKKALSDFKTMRCNIRLQTALY